MRRRKGQPAVIPTAIHGVTTGHMVVEKAFRTVDILVPISLDPFPGAAAHQAPERTRPMQGFTIGAARLPLKTKRNIPVRTFQ